MFRQKCKSRPSRGVDVNGEKPPLESVEDWPKIFKMCLWTNVRTDSIEYDAGRPFVVSWISIWPVKLEAGFPCFDRVNQLLWRHGTVETKHGFVELSEPSLVAS